MTLNKNVMRIESVITVRSACLLVSPSIGRQISGAAEKYWCAHFDPLKIQSVIIDAAEMSNTEPMSLKISIVHIADAV